MLFSVCPSERRRLHFLGEKQDGKGLTQLCLAQEGSDRDRIHFRSRAWGWQMYLREKAKAKKCNGKYWRYLKQMKTLFVSKVRAA